MLRPFGTTVEEGATGGQPEPGGGSSATPTRLVNRDRLSASHRRAPRATLSVTGRDPSQQDAAPATTAVDQLAVRLAADLEGCFEELVLGYQDRLFAFAFRLTGSAQDAEEIAQDAFVRAYRALQGYPAERLAGMALRPWLYQIVLNVARNRGRGKRLRVQPLVVSGEDGETVGVPEPADEREGPEAIAERRAHGADLAGLVAGLPARYRAPVILRHVEGLSYTEVAAVLGQPVGTAKANVHRGVRLLREALTEGG